MVPNRHTQALEQSPSTGARTSGAEPPSGARSRPDLASWRGLLLTGAGAAVASVALTAVQVVVFATHPPPQTIEGVMQLMQRNPLLGLVSLDIVICVNNVLVALIYLALAAALFQTARSLVTIALGLGMLGIAAYLGSNPAVELLLLSREHARAPSGQRAALLAAGDGLLAPGAVGHTCPITSSARPPSSSSPWPCCAPTSSPRPPAGGRSPPGCS